MSDIVLITKLKVICLFTPNVLHGALSCRMFKVFLVNIVSSSAKFSCSMLYITILLWKIEFLEKIC